MIKKTCCHCPRNVFMLLRRQLNEQASQKLLKVGIYGAPNTGKSTLINRVVNARVSAVTDIKHTTRSLTNGVFTRGNTQVVLTDTPGIIPYEEGRRLKLSRSHMTSPYQIIDSIDMIAVLKDVTCKRTREYIDDCVLDIINENRNIPAVLVLNKVDLLKRKTDLLSIATILLEDRKKDVWGYKPLGGTKLFKECFMVSSLTGDGLESFVDYLMMNARPGPWEYDKEVFCDASIQKQIAEVFRERILVTFPHEIPWQVKQDTILLHNDADALRIHQKLTWPKKSQQRFVLANIEQLTKECEVILTDMFQCEIILTVDVRQKNKMTTDDLLYY